MRYITLLLTWIFASVMVNAADFKFQHLNTSCGLPNQQGECMVQDNNGYIWIGTRNGLARYDGYNVEGSNNHLNEHIPESIGNLVNLKEL